jgi:hypothetical protein
MINQKRAIVNQVRLYLKDCTISNVYLPDREGRFCYALEDVGRPLGVKVWGETCIPEGMYRLVITYSQRFKKEMVQVYNTSADMLVSRHGVDFSGVRIHGGNTTADTLGCPLYAYNYDDDAKVWGRASDELLAWVRAEEARGVTCYLCISEEIQA